MSATRVAAAKPATVWFETFLITVGTLALAQWIAPGNPLGVGTQFPWVWLGPVLVALRYGVAPGVASVAGMFGVWLLLRQFNLLQSQEFPKLALLGGFLTTLLCAEFSSAWQNRLRYLEQINAYGEERLKELTRKYYLLHLSHDRLYENLISKPATLSDSLLRLRRLMAEESRPGVAATAALPGLQAMLSLLTQTCQLTSAAVYRVEDDRVLPAVLAQVGNVNALQADDPLIIHALENDSAAHINMKELEGVSPSSYLVAVPLRRLTGEWVAILLVERMPFMAFVQENLQILLALVSYYADGLIASRDSLEVHQHYPDCPLDFIDVLARLTRMRNIVTIDSALVLMRFPTTDQGREVMAEIRRTQRTLDMEWCYERDARLYRLVLMPLTGNSAVRGFFTRMESQLQARLGKSLEELGVHSKVTMVTNDTLESLRNVLGERA
jgi:polysaccharide biosynthesis protein PelD